MMEGVGAATGPRRRRGEHEQGNDAEPARAHGRSLAAWRTPASAGLAREAPTRTSVAPLTRSHRAELVHLVVSVSTPAELRPPVRRSAIPVGALPACSAMWRARRARAAVWPPPRHRLRHRACAGPPPRRRLTAPAWGRLTGAAVQSYVTVNQPRCPQAGRRALRLRLRSRRSAMGLPWGGCRPHVRAYAGGQREAVAATRRRLRRCPPRRWECSQEQATIACVLQFRPERNAAGAIFSR